MSVVSLYKKFWWWKAVSFYHAKC